MNPCDWSAKDKEAFLDLIEKMGTNSVWRPAAIKGRLESLPCSVELSESGNTLVIFGSEVQVPEPVYGEPGIFSMNLLQHIVDRCEFDERITSDMTGSGFYMRDVLSQLAVKWGVNKDYL